MVYDWLMARGSGNDISIASRSAMNRLSWQDYNPKQPEERARFLEIKKLAREYNIKIIWQDKEMVGWASQEGYNTIILSPLRTKLNELVALHEIGHIANNHFKANGIADDSLYSQYKLEHEAEAWAWVFDRFGHDDESRSFAASLMTTYLFSTRHESLPEPKHKMWDVLYASDEIHASQTEFLKDQARKWLREPPSKINLDWYRNEVFKKFYPEVL